MTNILALFLFTYLISSTAFALGGDMGGGRATSSNLQLNIDVNIIEGVSTQDGDFISADDLKESATTIEKPEGLYLRNGSIFSLKGHPPIIIMLNGGEMGGGR